MKRLANLLIPFFLMASIGCGTQKESSELSARKGAAKKCSTNALASLDWQIRLMSTPGKVNIMGPVGLKNGGYSLRKVKGGEILLTYFTGLKRDLKDPGFKEVGITNLQVRSEKAVSFPVAILADTEAGDGRSISTTLQEKNGTGRSTVINSRIPRSDRKNIRKVIVNISCL